MTKRIEVISHTCCPCCGGREWRAFKKIYSHGATLEYQLCDNCSLLFLNPVPTQDWYNSLYAGEFWQTKSEQKSRSGIIVNEVQWKKELRRAERFLDFLNCAGVAPAPGSRIIEIGCAYGLTVSTLSKHFNSVPLGVEASRVVSKFAGRYANVEMIAENMDGLAEWEPEDSVDMFIFSHVMENIVDLDKVFRTIYRLLGPRGFVLMDTPNLFFTTSLHIYHPYSFCMRSLHHLFGRHGFEIVRIEATGRPNVVFSPKYLTVLAQKRAERTDAVRVGSVPSPFNGMRIRLGQLWAQVAGRFPMSFIDKKISQHVYSLAPERLKRVEEVREKVMSPEGPAAG